MAAGALPDGDALMREPTADGRFGDFGGRFLPESLVPACQELERALTAGASLVGVNQRDLATFEVDEDRAQRLAELIPHGVVKVAESGIRDAAGAASLRRAGYDAILVGESLVVSSDPTAALRALRL